MWRFNSVRRAKQRGGVRGISYSELERFIKDHSKPAHADEEMIWISEGHVHLTDDVVAVPLMNNFLLQAGKDYLDRCGVDGQVMLVADATHNIGTQGFKLMSDIGSSDKDDDEDTHHNDNGDSDSSCSRSRSDMEQKLQ